MIARATAALVALAGPAIAAPASALDREIPCPAMPPSSDSSRTSSGGLSLQLGGFGLDGKRERSTEQLDVLIRRNGLEDWSAAAVLAYACEANKRVFKGDVARQRDELIALRERLVRPTRQIVDQSSRYSAASTYTDVRSTGLGQRSATGSPQSTGWTFNELWRPSVGIDWFPRAARAGGLATGKAQIDCNLSRELGMSDCWVVSETPGGFGFGAAAIRYLTSLRLNDGPLSANWAPRRIRRDVALSR